MTNTLTYKSWQAMMSRCFNPKHPCYALYSNFVPCEFLSASPLNLIVLIGERRASEFTVDRINNAEGYHCGGCRECIEKGWKVNIRWATKKEQGRNRKNNKPVTIGGILKTLPEWSEELGVPIPTLRRHYVRDYYYNPVNENKKN